MDSSGQILIADDDEEFLVSTSAVLRLQGYQTDCVPDAPAAVAQLRAKPYDLLISDIDMPGNQDLGLLRDLPQLKAGLPVILATGKPSVQTAVQAIELAVVGYLVKPFEPSELLKLVAVSIERHRAYQAIREHRQRLLSACQELEQIEGVIRADARGAAPTPWNAFPAVTLHTIVDCLVDLQHYAEAITPRHPPAGTAAEPASPALIQALRETIAVLEKTRQAFKSKDLGDLRKRLERLLRPATEENSSSS